MLCVYHNNKKIVNISSFHNELWDSKLDKQTIMLFLDYMISAIVALPHGVLCKHDNLEISCIFLFLKTCSGMVIPGGFHQLWWVFFSKTDFW